jgi:hypothetical protein
MLVYDEENPATSKPAGAFDDLIPSKKSQPGAFDDLVPGKSGRLVYDEPATGIPLAGGHLVFDEEPTKPTVNQKRTWLQAAGDTAIDAAKGVVGLGESVVGLTDLVTGNLSGEGWSGIGFDPARTRRILSELYSDPRQQANRNVSDAKGFIDTTKAMVQNPSAAVGSMVESAPLMVGGAAAVRTVATKMLAAQGLAAGSAEAAAFLARPDVLARLTAIGSAAEGALTAGNIQEQGRQAGRSYSDTAPAAVAGGAITGLVGFGTSKIPGFKDSEVELQLPVWVARSASPSWQQAKKSPKACSRRASWKSYPSLPRSKSGPTWHWANRGMKAWRKPQRKAWLLAPVWVAA